jgi:hypothetical protein
VTFLSSATGNMEHVRGNFSESGINVNGDASVTLTSVIARLNTYGLYV